MSNGRLQLEPSDAGSCSRVGNTKRWTQTSTGKSVTELVMVSLDLERACVRTVHSVAASEHQRCAISPGRGAHTLLGEHFEGTGLMCASKTASEGALGLVHHRGPCTGQVDCGQQKGGGKGAALFSSLRPPHTVHWAWCITGGGAGG